MKYKSDLSLITLIFWNTIIHMYNWIICIYNSFYCMFWIIEVHTSRSIGYLPLSPDGINMSPSMTFKVKGCGKLYLAFHNMNRMAFAIRRHEIQIDNSAAYSVTTSIAAGYAPTFKGLRVLKNGRMQQGNRCSDFRTFRVNYSGNTLLLEGCDLRKETLLRLSAPDLSMHHHMSAFSENQADWVFGKNIYCSYIRHWSISVYLLRSVHLCSWGWDL